MSLRILDASINRACEGIRVIEDMCRFKFQDKELTTDFRNLRHKIRKLFTHYDLKFITARNSNKDIGKKISQSSNLDKKIDDKSLIFANFKRVNEALRSIEEQSKVIDEYTTSKEVETLRFKSYDLEKKVSKYLKKQLPLGIYGITGEEFSKGRTNLECVKEMIKGGIKVIQYRDKKKTIKQKLSEIFEIRQVCRENNVCFIVNDYIDIALLVDADGVHVGQDDMDIASVRKLIGKDKIVGVSTHCKEHAQKALEDKADYIGVGPIFKTTTKEKDPVGLEYLEYIVDNIDLPFVAIGGIKESNIDKVIERKAKRICLVSEIVGAENIVEKISQLKNKMGE